MIDDKPGPICYEITHASEGERGRSVEIITRAYSLERCATEAADYFDDIDIDRDDPGDVSRCRWIEVTGFRDEPPARFLVRGRVERVYEAELIPREIGR